MFRQSISRPLAAPRAMVNRSFSSLAPRMGEGDTGAPKGSQAGSRNDQFQRREAANEAMYIREKEVERLKDLRSKISDQRKSLDTLEKHIDELSGEKGGK